MFLLCSNIIIYIEHIMSSLKHNKIIIFVFIDVLNRDYYNKDNDLIVTYIIW